MILETPFVFVCEKVSVQRALLDTSGLYVYVKIFVSDTFCRLHTFLLRVFCRISRCMCVCLLAKMFLLSGKIVGNTTDLMKEMRTKIGKTTLLERRIEK